MFIFNIADNTPQYHRDVTTQPSVLAPGKTLCARGGVTMVVEPTGNVRDLRPGEVADSPWCWATQCNDVLVYDTGDPSNPNPADRVIVMFKMVVPS